MNSLYHTLYDINACIQLGNACIQLGIVAVLAVEVLLGRMFVAVYCFLLQSVVQVETIGELGAVFIVFMAGLELSPDKLKKVSGNATSLIFYFSLTPIHSLLSIFLPLSSFPFFSSSLCGF